MTGVQQPAVVHEEQYDQQMQQYEQRRNVNHLTAHHDVTLNHTEQNYTLYEIVQ